MLNVERPGKAALEAKHEIETKNMRVRVFLLNTDVVCGKQGASLGFAYKQTLEQKPRILSKCALIQQKNTKLNITYPLYDTQ